MDLTYAQLYIFLEEFDDEKVYVYYKMISQKCLRKVN